MKTIKLIICICLLWMIGIGVQAEEIPNNEIWYTSMDGNIVKPYNQEFGGAIIISNSYKNGKGIISFDRDVTSIGNSAFDYCSGLTSITIPNSVTSIGEYAFDYCSGLTSITIPNSVTSIGEYAFYNCSGLTSIDIPNSVTSIGKLAFEYCSGLTSITLGNSVTSIGQQVFDDCSNLVSITIPNSVTSIGNYAFYRCSSLTSITIPSSVTSIGGWAFSGCSSLTSITIPNSVTSIGNGAFSGCTSLNSILVNSNNKKYDSRNNCNAIIETATNTLVFGCKNTVIPNSVTSIGYRAFMKCSSLTSITIPNSVTSIGDWAFDGCSGLTSITIPNSVTSIGSTAFRSCSGLTSITIPNSVTSIYAYAFQDCTGLTSITIPSSVTGIGGWAFSGCMKLIDIDVEWNQPLSIDSNVYSSVDLSKVTLHVPSGTKSKYQSADVWKEFGTIKEFDIPITSISLDKTSASIHPDESITLFATISPENATNTTISWKSSDTNIATVSNGIVTGINVGKATITATTTDDTDLSTSCEIIVTPILTKSISLNKSTAEMLVDDNLTLSATITPSNATNKDVEWSSSDNSIATVDNGIVKAIKVGTVTITAKTTDGSNLSATCNIKVVPISIYVSSVSLSKTSIDLLVEENATITATVYPDNASNPSLAWSSSDENVATVDGGKVTATGEGTATITARTVDGSDLSATCTVNVSRHSQSITWNQDLSNLTYGSELITLQATSSSGLPVSYKSSDDNVAIIFDMGNAIYLNPGIAGTAIITARQEGNNYYAPAEMTKVANVVQPDNVNGVNAVNGRYTVYTATGTKIGTYNESELRKLIDSHKLSGGLYIINGEKTIIK